MFQIDHVIQVLERMKANGCKGVVVKIPVGSATINLEERTLGTGEKLVLITPHECVRTPSLYEKAPPALPPQRRAVYNALDRVVFKSTNQIALAANIFYHDGSPDTATVGNVCRVLLAKGLIERERLPNSHRYGYRRK